MAEEHTATINFGMDIMSSSTTDFFITNNSVSAATFIDSGSTYVTRKLPKPKKKRGDKSDVNLQSQRLRLLSPVAVYRFIKKRFNIIERKRLSQRMERICQLMEDAKVVGQIALAEKIEERFGKLIREQELLACGIELAMKKTVLKRFMDASEKNIIKLTPLRNYARPIPKSVLKIVDGVKKKELFEELWVLHTDVNDDAVVKTREEKKDPILFGTIPESDSYYFVTDWVDELCDLTLDKLLERMGMNEDDVRMDDDVEQAFVNTIL